LLNKILYYIILLIPLISSYGQNSINTSGGNINSNGINLSYSIGQLKINTIGSNSSTLTLDFIQGVQYAFSIYDCSMLASVELSVYPNPSSKRVYIKTIDEPKLKLTIFDIAGRLIYEQTLQGSTTIDVENYANGTYIFAFYGFCGLIKSFKVLKNN
tara:strand:- start:597 stop:1067 length:471 start_codon:yes stop_codon:yes gene_type:complete